MEHLFETLRLSSSAAENQTKQHWLDFVKILMISLKLRFKFSSVKYTEVIFTELFSFFKKNARKQTETLFTEKLFLFKNWAEVNENIL